MDERTVDQGDDGRALAGFSEGSSFIPAMLTIGPFVSNGGLDTAKKAMVVHEFGTRGHDGFPVRIPG